MQTLTRAEFLGTPVHILDHEGRRWLTARDVGVCLGYSEEFARQAIIKLYNRHADEFGAEDTCEVNLTSQGQSREYRIFSQTGCILLAMFANTARAKDFRAWAKRVLSGEAALPAEVALPAGAQSVHTARISRAVERQAMELWVAGLGLPTIARHLGISKAACSMLLHGKYRFGPNAGADETTPQLLAAVAAEHLRREKGRITERFIASAANLRLQAQLESVGTRMLCAIEQVEAAQAPLTGLEG